MADTTWRYAQTNLQLYGQLVAAGWAEDDLRQVQSAYRLAMQVVAGHFQASEKTLLAHQVGVASILAAHGGRVTIVSAGLLHSVYRQGDFGDGGSGLLENHRRTVRRAVGSACEQLVAAYAAADWSIAGLETLLGKSRHLAAVEQAIALIKLADLLEKTPDVDPAEGPASVMVPLAIRLATALGHDGLARELSEAAVSKPLPDFLLPARTNAFAVAPMSHAMRAGVRVVRWLHSIRELLPLGSGLPKRAA
jgi:hypothetical protein